MRLTTENASLEKQMLERDLSLVLGRAFRFHSADSILLDPAILKRAFRRRAHELHPDKAVARGLDPEYLSDRFRDLQEAFLRTLGGMESGAYFRMSAVSRPSNPAHAASAAKPSGYQRDRPRPFQAADEAQNRQRPGPDVLRVFHSGTIPRMRLRIAQYLYYTRRIDWDTLIKSLAWQFHFRPKLGELGVELGYLQPAQVLDILKSKRIDETFGAAALRSGCLDQFRLSVLLGRQRLLGLPIGRYFLDNGFIGASGLEDALKALCAHNRSIHAARHAAGAA
jgi:hypothetical protein